MTRMNGMSMEVFEPMESFLVMLLTLLSLGALLMLMALTKRTGADSSPPMGSSSQKRSKEGLSVQERQERRNKAKHDARMQRIEEKVVTCERYVDRVSLGPSNEVMRIIKARG